MRKTLFIFCLMSVLLAGFSLAAARGVSNETPAKSYKAAGLMAPPPPVGYPVDDSVVLMESFEDGVPPHSWGRWIQNEYATWMPDMWEYVVDGDYMAYVPWDYNQDEWLISPKINLANFPNFSLSFYWMTSWTWAIDYDTFDLEVYVRVNDLADWELVWSDDDYLGPPFQFDRWIYTEVDLSPWAGAKNARFAFRYVGDDGADLMLDQVMGHANTAELELAGDAEVLSSACPEGIVPEAPLPVRATILDAGDQATVEIALANTGTGPATNVRGILTPKNPWAKVVQGTVNFGTISAGNTGTGTAVIKSHWNTPCSEIVAYELLVMCDQGSWTFNVNFPLGDIKDTILPIEMFESGIPPTWTVVDNYAGYSWMTNRDYLNNFPLVDGEGMDNKTGGYGDCATAHGYNLGFYDAADTELRTPSFSLAGVSGAHLTFDVAVVFNMSEYFAVDMSTDGGATWFEKLFWNGVWTTQLPQEVGPQLSIRDRRVELDLSDSVGQANCMLRFYYFNDYAVWSFAQVDNVAVREFSCANVFFEDFEGENGLPLDKQPVFPPPGWQSNDLSGSSVTWNSTYYWSDYRWYWYYIYNPTVGQNGDGVGIDTSNAWNSYLNWDPVNMVDIPIETDLISPPIDLTPPVPDVVPVLTFDSTFINYTWGGSGPYWGEVPQKGWLYASVDDGATWTLVAEYNDQHMGIQRIPLNRYTGYTVMLKWLYSDLGYIPSGFWYIDDVSIDFCDGCLQGNCLGVDCPATVSDDVIQVGDTVYFDALGDTNCPDATLNFTWLIQTTAEGCVKVLTGPSAEWTFNEPGEYDWHLTVTAPECGIDCEKSGTILVDNPFDMFIYDNEGRVNFFFNMYSGRYQFRIFDEDDPYHAGTYNGWGVLAECNVAPQDGEVYWCFYTYEGYGWFMQVVLDMTHHIYRGWIMLEDGYYVEFYDDSHRTP